MGQGVINYLLHYDLRDRLVSLCYDFTFLHREDLLRLFAGWFDKTMLYLERGLVVLLDFGLSVSDLLLQFKYLVRGSAAAVDCLG